jgi:hypothetical protein
MATKGVRIFFRLTTSLPRRQNQAGRRHRSCGNMTIRKTNPAVLKATFAANCYEKPSPEAGSKAGFETVVKRCTYELGHRRAHPTTSRSPIQVEAVKQ